MLNPHTHTCKELNDFCIVAMATGFFSNTMEFGAFWLAQANVATFPSHRRAFRGMATVHNFDIHMEFWGGVTSPCVM
jgi:hypothetical protein